MLPRPRFRLPIWAAFAIVAAAYVVRSVIRGFDFRPDLPADAVVIVALVVVVALVAWTRSDIAGDDQDTQIGADEGQDTDTHDTTEGPAA